MERFHIGERVRARASIPYATYALIAKGEHGRVDDVFPGIGVSIHWDEVHAGLRQWDNCTLLADDTIMLLKPWAALAVRVA
jgi:hypothetical protein